MSSWDSIDRKAGRHFPRVTVNKEAVQSSESDQNLSTDALSFVLSELYDSQTKCSNYLILVPPFLNEYLQIESFIRSCVCDNKIAQILVPTKVKNQHWILIHFRKQKLRKNKYYVDTKVFDTRPSSQSISTAICAINSVIQSFSCISWKQATRNPPIWINDMGESNPIRYDSCDTGFHVYSYIKVLISSLDNKAVEPLDTINIRKEVHNLLATEYQRLTVDINKVVIENVSKSLKKKNLVSSCAKMLALPNTVNKNVLDSRQKGENLSEETLSWAVFFLMAPEGFRKVRVVSTSVTQEIGQKKSAIPANFLDDSVNEILFPIQKEDYSWCLIHFSQKPMGCKMKISYQYSDKPDFYYDLKEQTMPRIHKILIILKQILECNKENCHHWISLIDGLMMLSYVDNFMEQLVVQDYNPSESWIYQRMHESFMVYSLFPQEYGNNIDTVLRVGYTNHLDVSRYSWFTESEQDLRKREMMAQLDRVTTKARSIFSKIVSVQADALVGFGEFLIASTLISIGLLTNSANQEEYFEWSVLTGSVSFAFFVLALVSLSASKMIRTKADVQIDFRTESNFRTDMSPDKWFNDHLKMIYPWLEQHRKGDMLALSGLACTAIGTVVLLISVGLIIQFKVGSLAQKDPRTIIVVILLILVGVCVIATLFYEWWNDLGIKVATAFKKVIVDAEQNYNARPSITPILSSNNIDTIPAMYKELVNTLDINGKGKQRNKLDIYEVV